MTTYLAYLNNKSPKKNKTLPPVERTPVILLMQLINTLFSSHIFHFFLPRHFPVAVKFIYFTGNSCLLLSNEYKVGEAKRILSTFHRNLFICGLYRLYFSFAFSPTSFCSFFLSVSPLLFTLVNLLLICFHHVRLYVH